MRPAASIEGDAALQDPIFLVASERSGTTLLRLMLDGHPQLSWHFEFEWAVQLIGPDGSFPPVEEYLRWLEEIRGFHDAKVEIDPSLGYADLVRSFLEQKRITDNKPLSGATVHRFFDRIPYVWPNARYIHLVRDGRDVSRSCVVMGWDGNSYCAADRWVEVEELWNQFSAGLETSRYHDVVYEELIADPEKVLTKICQFIGVEFDKKMFSYVDETNYKYPNPKRVYQWKRNASKDEIQLMESKLRNLLTERGYELSGYAPITVNPLREKFLEFDSKWRRRLHNVKNYGLLLFLAANVTRRLPGKYLYTQVIKKMHDIERRNLK